LAHHYCAGLLLGVQLLARHSHDISDSLRPIVTTGSESMLADLPKDKDKWIAMDNNKLVFNILEPEITRYGLTRTFHELDPSSDDIYDVLSEAASFYHLFNQLAVPNSDLENNIKIEFRRLKNSTGHVDGPFDVFDGPNLFCDGVINIVIEKNAKHGLKVTNNTSEDLFLGVWLFDHIDFDFEDKSEYPHST
jgi:hypothetical protein